jgi:hypothetical protein
MQSYLLNWLRELRADPQAQKNLAFTITLAMVCLTIGYLIGEASSGGLVDSSKEDPNAAQGTNKSWPNSYDVKVHADSSDEEAGADSDEEDEETEEDGKELKNFEDTADEVKLVLVVRKDLNMGNGKLGAVIRLARVFTFLRPPEIEADFLPYRQNRRSSFSRHSGLLQVLAQSCPFSSASETLGKGWPGQDRSASEVRRRAIDAASSSNELGTMRKDHSRCRKNTNRSREHNCAWNPGT